MKLQRLDALFVPIVFEHGVSPGEGTDMNRLTVALDGLGRPVLRGTSIAGVLRRDEQAVAGEEVAKIWFGYASDGAGRDSQGTDSLVQVDTAVLNVGNSGVVQATHHLRNRHTGVVAKGGLFSMEACPPGTTAVLAIWVRVPPGYDFEANELTRFLCRRFEHGLVFGGRSARGVGVAKLNGDIRGKSYDLGTPTGWINQLSDLRSWRERSQVPADASKLPRLGPGTAAREQDLDNQLKITVKLRIPRGQDLLIAEGDDASPQVVQHTDGKLYWKLPGSTMRGAFKSWMTRLAARDGKSVQDNHAKYQALSRKEQAEHPKATTMMDDQCPINQLFGTVDNKHRIHFSDAYAIADGTAGGKVSSRTHVAIDRVTGESADGLLFENEVLTADDHDRSPVFSMVIRLANPRSDEAVWLARALTALHVGVLRIGSSKAAGRLEVMPPAIAKGPMNQKFTETFERLFGIRRLSSSPPVVSSSKVDGVLTRNKKGELVVSYESEHERRIVKKLLQFDLSERELPLPVSIEVKKKKPTAIYLREVSDAADTESGENGSDSSPVAAQSVWDQAKVDQPVPLTPQQRQQPADGRFHNPYTFIPFASGLCRRGNATFLTGDELGKATGKLTGYLDLEIELLRPLLTCQPKSSSTNRHAVLDPLTIGNDVILPSTGIRGSLRTLMTILSSGTLGYINRHGFLCHKRDLPLSTDGEKERSRGVLAEVVTVGGHNKPGRVRIGDTRLVHLDKLHTLFGGQASLDSYRPAGHGEIQHQWIELDSAGKPISYERRKSDRHCWKMKLSGRPVGWTEGDNKYEGLFQDSGEQIDVAAKLWQDYAERNKRRGTRSQLKRGDLVWLEVKEGTPDPVTADSVLSIQWARWGKKGKRVDELATDFKPDYLQSDGFVDEVTNLFGQVIVQDVADNNVGDAFAFAGKIRPENLVFEGLAAATRNHQVTLPVLAQPNGGCIPFYRQANHPDAFRRESPLRGYKVYRVEHDPEFDVPNAPRDQWISPKPWEYAAQPLYPRDSNQKPAKNDMNKTVALVPAKSVGRLRIAFRSLSQRELAMLIQACHVRWRLGGGKSVSLGLCQPKVTGLFNETGQPLQVDWRDRDGNACRWRDLVADIQNRVAMWSATQTPVPLVRQPRAINTRGAKNGLVWFTNFCQMKMGDPPEGLQPRKNVYLPEFDVHDPTQDWLTGYDANIR